MSNCRIGYGNLIDSCNLSATTSTYSFLPVGYLKSLSRTEVMRCTAAQEIKGNFANTSTLGMAAIWRHSLVGSWSLYLYSGANQGGSVVYSQTGITVNAVWFTEVNAASFKLVFSSAGVFDLSRVFLGRYFEPQDGMDVGVNLAFNDVTEQSRTQGGSVHLIAGAQYRSFDFDMTGLEQTDREKLSSILQAVGKRADLYFSGAPDNMFGLKNDLEMLCVIKSTPGYTLPYAWYANTKIQLEEC